MSVTAPGLSDSLAAACPACHAIAPMHAPNCPLTAAQAGLKALAPSTPPQAAPVMAFTIDRPATEDILASVLGAPVPELPSQEQRIGSSTILWWETDPGEVYIHAEDGTADDRHYGSTLVELQLAPHGFRRAQFDVDDMGEPWRHSLGGVMPEPPNYRKATTKDHCGGCKMFDNGLCWGYGNKPVKTDYVCDSFSPEATKHAAVHASFERTASWVDIMAKARRLIESGQVQILRNGYTNVMGHVIGDHGQYDTEFSRDDPQSRSITGWQCTCPWDQYAWQRTRKWKKFEGRLCAHALGLFWQSLSTPLDHELTEEQAEGLGTGQKIGPHDDGLPPEGAPTEGPGPDSHEVKLPRSFGPEGDILQGDQLPLNPPPDATGAPPGPAQAPLAPPPGQGAPPEGAPPGGPTPPGVLPPFPGAPPPEAPPWGGPGTTPGGGVSPPGAYSVPGAKPPAQPANPIQNPGTYSRTSMAQQSGDPELDLLLQEFAQIADLKEAQPAYWHDDVDPTTLYQSPYWAAGNCDVMAKTFAAWINQRGLRASIKTGPVNSFPGYEDAEYYDPENVERGGLFDGHNLNAEAHHAITEVHMPSGTYSVDWTASQYNSPEFPKVERVGKVSAQFNAPEVVRLKKDMMGVAEGPVPGQYGDGSYRDVPAGSPLDVIYQDPSTGWVECTAELNDSGPNEPFRVRCFVEPSDIEKTDRASDIIRRA